MPKPRRKWSQHWLANDDLAVALVRLIEPGKGDRFLEIGAGLGRLTRALLRHPVEVTAIEIDRRCCQQLRALAEEAGRPSSATPGNESPQGGKLTVIEGDVLELDPATMGIEPPLRLVGNLPYSIASPILRWSVEHRDDLADVHFMLPAEVAERVLAPAASRLRGLLSVCVQWHYEGAILRRLGPGAFRPPPAIDSAFVRLRRRTPPACKATGHHRRAVTEAAFAHRRKTLANTLRRAGWSPGAIAEACESAGIDAGARAEALSAESFARLAEALPEKRP